jgi:phosphate transport system substrate-binding protein
MNQNGFKLIGLGALALLLVTGCQNNSAGQTESPGNGPGSGSAASNLEGSIKVDGSSTVFPITEAVAEEFMKTNPGVRVTVGVSGTGGGFKKFGAGETDVSNASRPIKSSEGDAAKEKGIEFIELPVAYDALSVVVNPKNDWVDHLTVEELKKIWEPAAQGKITNWNQVRPGFPDKPLKLYGAGTDSGTFDYFTDAINGEEKASRGDYTASEDDNVLVQGVSQDVNALAYFGLAYLLENEGKLKAVPIDDGKSDNGDGPQPPTVESVEAGSYQPLARPIFIYVSKTAAERPEVKAFIEYYLANAAKLVREVGYVPLPQEVYDLALERFKAGKTGSVFTGGSQVGVKLADLLKVESGN